MGVSAKSTIPGTVTTLSETLFTFFGLFPKCKIKVRMWTLEMVGSS